MGAFDNLIITENYFKSQTTISTNLDMKVVTPVLFEVQDMFIKPLLGTKLFDQILTEISTSTVTTANQTLLDNYVLPCLLQYAKCEVLPEMKYRLRNKGVMVSNNEYSSSADLQEIQFLMERTKNKAEWYAERTTRFIKKNINDYPLFYQNTAYDEIRPNKTNFTGGIYIGNTPQDDIDDYNIIIGNY